MCKWMLVSMVAIALAVGTAGATEPDGKALAQKGYNLFKDVLSGDRSKLPEAIRAMEEARAAEETYVPNLFNLARAYFFEAGAYNNAESIAKAEKLFARVVELDAKRTDALAFHGSLLVQMSGGRDLPMFMRGAQEIKSAAERTPNDITVRIVRGFTVANVPAEARPFLGVTDPVSDLQFVQQVFQQFESDFAPHASVVMDGFLGDALLMTGEKEKAREAFERALKIPQPLDEGTLAARKYLDNVIRTRMNGGDKPVSADAIFSGYHACHLATPDTLLGVK